MRLFFLVHVGNRFSVHAIEPRGRVQSSQYTLCLRLFEALPVLLDTLWGHLPIPSCALINYLPDSIDHSG